MGHGGGGVFAAVPAQFAPEQLPRGEAGVLVEPAGEVHPARELVGVAGQIAEDGLGHIVRQVRMIRQKPPGSGVDQINVRQHQRREGAFVAGGEVAAPKLGGIEIGGGLNRHSIEPAATGNRTGWKWNG